MMRVLVGLAVAPFAILSALLLGILFVLVTGVSPVWPVLGFVAWRLWRRTR